jgi:hypothetical protein
MRTRALLAAAAVLAGGCATVRRHPRATITVAVGAAVTVVVGVPLQTGCTGDTPDDCGARHDAIVYGLAGLGGFVLGALIAKAADYEPAPTRVADVRIAPPRGRGEVRAAGRGAASHPAAACLLAREQLAARLEASCTGGLAARDDLEADCACAGDACTIEAGGTCDVGWFERSAVAWAPTAEAASDDVVQRARLACTRGTYARVVVETCRCEPAGAFCGCRARYACAYPEVK